MSDERPGHQDRAYASRIKRLRERAAQVRIGDRAGIKDAVGVLQGMLDVLADLVADQEEAERAR